MNRPELHKRTTDILVDAYFNDTLKHSDCRHCAVGNILKEHAVAINVPVQRWANLFITVTNHDEQHRQEVAQEDEVITSFLGLLIEAHKITDAGHTRLRKEAELLIERSGYTVGELAQIEWAFEVADKGNSEDEWMFNGLMAVIDTLDIIHDNTDGNLTQATKHRFNKLNPVTGDTPLELSHYYATKDFPLFEDPTQDEQCESHIEQCRNEGEYEPV